MFHRGLRIFGRLSRAAFHPRVEREARNLPARLGKGGAANCHYEKRDQSDTIFGIEDGQPTQISTGNVVNASRLA